MLIQPRKSTFTIVLKVVEIKLMIICCRALAVLPRVFCKIKAKAAALIGIR